MLRYGPCRGLKLFQYGQYRVELWFFPRNYSIEVHSHPCEDIEVLYLFGSCQFFRMNKLKIVESTVSWKSNFIPRLLSLPAGYFHWFDVGFFPMIAINFSKFLDQHKPESASIDFKLYNEKV